MTEEKSELPPAPETTTDQETEARASAYWRANIRLLILLMAIWFLVSFGAGILFRVFLDQWSIAGYPLGFWFAQQGSIYVFIALIVVYVRLMRAIEKRFGMDDE